MPMMTVQQRLQQIVRLEDELRSERAKVVKLQGHIFGAASPAARYEYLLDLYAPMTEHEDGTVTRDPRYGTISEEMFRRLLDAPAHAASSGGGSSSRS